MSYRTSLVILLFACGVVPTFAAEPEFRSLFNGKDLAGWDGEAGLWRVKDGVIEGGHPDAGPLSHSSWLILRDGDRDAILRDFHFRCDFKMRDFNSGVQYRSTRSHPKGFRVGGYQADLLNGFGTGQLHQEAHQGASVGVGESVINEQGRVRGFGTLVCDGRGKGPLALAGEHGTAFVFRCQVKTDAWKPGDRAPFKGVDGWNLLEVTVRDSTAAVEYNGEPRKDVPPPVAGGKLALPGDVAAAYRNLVLIPILPAK